MAALHRSAARRQSLHVDVDVVMDGGMADVYGILYIDGKPVAHLDTFPVRNMFLSYSIPVSVCIYVSSCVCRYGRSSETSARAHTT